MLEQTSHGFSIRRMLKKRFLDMVKSIPAPKMGRILVVDEVAKTYLDACVEQKDLFLTEVSLYEQLELPRNGYPEVEALYLLTPTWESIERLVKDFTEGSKLHPGPLYGGAYLYFTKELGDDMYQYLTQSTAAFYIQNIVEYFVDFFAPEAQVFTTKTPHTLSELYSTTPTKSRHQALKDMAKKIVSLNVVLGENPVIKYFKPDGELNTSEVSYDLAELVQEEFDLLQRGKQYLQTLDPRQPRATLIVLDRTVDLRAPLLHEVTYQAIVHDLLCLPEDATYTYKYVNANGMEIDKEGALNEDDPIWVENRHIPFDQCVQNLVAKITKLGNKKLVNQPDMSASAKLSQLRETLYSLPEYQDIKEKCSLHMSLSLECTELFTKLDIERLALLEQDLATGVRENGEAAKHMVDELVPILDDPSISPDNKLRILILYILSKDGLREETWQEISFHAQLDLNKKDNAAIRSLDRLGVKLDKSNKKASNLCKKLKTFQEPTDFLMIARYVPVVKQIVENFIQNTLPSEIFPTMTSNHHGNGAGGHGPTTQTLRHMAPKWTKRKKGSLGECVTQKGRIIVFMIGGMTHSEMRSVYEISKELNREVIIGSTHVLPPWDFLDSLRALQNQADQSDILPSIRSLSIDSTSSDQLRSWNSNIQAVHIPRSLGIPKPQSPVQPSFTTPTDSEPTTPSATLDTRRVSVHKEPEISTSQTSTSQTPEPQSICNASRSIVEKTPSPVNSATLSMIPSTTPKIEVPTTDAGLSRNFVASAADTAKASKPSSLSETTPPALPVVASRSVDSYVVPSVENSSNDTSLNVASTSAINPATSRPVKRNSYVDSFSKNASSPPRKVEPEPNVVTGKTIIAPHRVASPDSMPIVTQSAHPVPPARTDPVMSTESTGMNLPTRPLYRQRPRSTLSDPTLSRNNSSESNLQTPLTQGSPIETRSTSANSMPERVESYPSPSPSPPPLPVHPRLKNQRIYSNYNNARGNLDPSRTSENSTYTSTPTSSAEYRPPLPKKPTNYPPISSFTTTTSNPRTLPSTNQDSYNKPPPKLYSKPKPLPPVTQSFSQLPNPDVNYSRARPPSFQTYYDPAAGIPMPDLYTPHVHPQTNVTSAPSYAMDSPNTFPDPMHYMPTHSLTSGMNMPPIPTHNQVRPPMHMPVYSSQATQPASQTPTYTPYGRPLPKRPTSNRYQTMPADDPIHQRYYR